MARDVDVLTETVIRRPRQEVAAYAGDPSHAPEWYANISSIEWRTPPPVAVGSRMDFVATFLGRRLAYTYEVTEKRIVQPDSLAIAIQSDAAEIVLTTCNPKYSAEQRLIVYAELVL